MQAFIKDFTEGSGRNPFQKRDNTQGEIAIVVKVFEMTSENDFDFKGGSSLDGRLVYYSDDVRKQQFLNFSQMPIYGPITYKGQPLAIVIHILELDSSKAQAKKLMKPLAELGQKAFAPGEPILKILDMLGGALLSGNETTDDVEFRYYMVLSPGEGGHADLSHGYLEAGNYVFIREEDRQKDTEWEKITLNQNEGRLKWENSQSSSIAGANLNRETDYYKDNTYLVVQINKGFDGVELDLKQNTYRVFRDFLYAKEGGIEKQFLAELSKKKKRTVMFAVARTALNKLKNDQQMLVDTRERLITQAINIIVEAITNEESPQNKEAVADLEEKKKKAKSRMKALKLKIEKLESARIKAKIELAKLDEKIKVEKDKKKLEELNKNKKILVGNIVCFEVDLNKSSEEMARIKNELEQEKELVKRAPILTTEQIDILLVKLQENIRSTNLLHLASRKHLVKNSELTEEKAKKNRKSIIEDITPSR